MATAKNNSPIQVSKIPCLPGEMTCVRIITILAITGATIPTKLRITTISVATRTLAVKMWADPAIRLEQVDQSLFSSKAAFELRTGKTPMKCISFTDCNRFLTLLNVRISYLHQRSFLTIGPFWVYSATDSVLKNRSCVSERFRCLCARWSFGMRGECMLMSHPPKPSSFSSRKYDRSCSSVALNVMAIPSPKASSA